MREMPYQREFPDGFVTNKFLKKPRTRGGLIYTVLDRESYDIDGDVFLPSWDDTDHFHFVCGKCKGVADVLEVNFYTHYSAVVKYALFFYLGCRKCGASGQRKIYLDRRVDACIFHLAYDDDEGKVYLYAKKDEPETIITARIIEEARNISGEHEN